MKRAVGVKSYIYTYTIVEFTLRFEKGYQQQDRVVQPHIDLPVNDGARLEESEY